MAFGTLCFMLEHAAPLRVALGAVSGHVMTTMVHVTTVHVFEWSIFEWSICEWSISAASWPPAVNAPLQATVQGHREQRA